MHGSVTSSPTRFMTAGSCCSHSRRTRIKRTTKRSILYWQLRHSTVHNVGVITRSDAVKLRVLSGGDVLAPRVLEPTRADLVYLRRFLDETTADCNKRIGERLAELLSDIHAKSPTLFDPQNQANRISAAFHVVLKVGNAAGVIPPD